MRDLGTRSYLPLGKVPIPSGSIAVAVNEAETRIYATMLNGSVAVIDGTTDTLLTSIPVGDAWGLSLDSCDALLYVANNDGDSVAVIDTATNTVIDSVPVGDMPRSVGRFLTTDPDCPEPPPFDCSDPDLCDDGDPCTQDSCSPFTGCANEMEPRDDCRDAEKSLLLLKDAGDAANDKWIWKWVKGASTTEAELADPTDATDYALCIYAGISAGFVTSAFVGADPLKWTASGERFKYTDPAGTQSGIRKVILKASDSNRAKILVKGKGTNVPDPTLGLAEPVTAQFVKVDSPLCWEATYSGSQIIENDNDEFKAKAD